MYLRIHGQRVINTDKVSQYYITGQETQAFLQAELDTGTEVRICTFGAKASALRTAFDQAEGALAWLLHLLTENTHVLVEADKIRDAGTKERTLVLEED